MSSLEKLEHYAEVRANLPALIREARREGETWEAIAKAAGMSRRGVINLARDGQ